MSQIIFIFYLAGCVYNLVQLIKHFCTKSFVNNLAKMKTISSISNFKFVLIATIVIVLITASSWIFYIIWNYTKKKIM